MTHNPTKDDEITPLQIKPCPFCGGTKISVVTGSRFRWVVAVCNQCGARAEKVRRNRAPKMKWGEEAVTRAIEAWNKRANA